MGDGGRSRQVSIPQQGVGVDPGVTSQLGAAGHGSSEARVTTRKIVFVFYISIVLRLLFCYPFTFGLHFVF